MKINLTTTQRRLAMGAAAAVCILLWLQADRVGLDQTPWLVGILIILALLFVAFAPSSEAAASSAAASLNAAPILPAKAVSAAYQVFEAEFMPVFEGTMQGLEKNETTVMVADNARLQAAKLGWMAAAMALERAYPGFRNGHRFESMMLIGGVEFRKHLRRMPSVDGSQAGAKSLEWAAKEMASCTVALDQASARIASNQPHPMTPLFNAVERAFPYAALTRAEIKDAATRMEAAYGPIFRKAVMIASAAT